MALVTINMGIPLPIVGETIGPDYAEMVNNALKDYIDGHTHLDGSGVKITAAALNINAQVDFSQSGTAQYLIGLKASRFINQTASLDTAADHLEIYCLNNDLYWKNDSGTDVQITDGGTLNTVGLVTNTYPTHSLSTDLTLSAAATYTLLLVNTAGNRTITLPLAAAVANGRYFIFKDVTGTADAHPISIVRAGSDTIDGGNAQSLNYPRGCWAVISNGVDTWNLQYLSKPYNIVNAQIDAGANIAGSKLADATGSTTGVVKLTADLGNTAAVPHVVEISGLADTVTVNCSNITFDNALTPVITIENSPDSLGNDMFIKAQDGYDVLQGGNLVLQGGNSADSSKLGLVVLGNATVQIDSGTVPGIINAGYYYFDKDIATPFIGQKARSTSGSGAPLTIMAQGADTSGDGGNILIATGQKGGVSDLGGSITIKSNGFSGQTMLKLASVGGANRYFASFFQDASGTELPGSTGEYFIYIKSAFDVPTFTPVGGCTVWHTATQGLEWKNTDGFSFGTAGEPVASAGGGGATLPPAPLGFMKAFIGGIGEVRIPFYGP